MKCTNCRFDNPIGASYCRRCGGPLRRKKAWIPSWISSAFSAVWAKKWLIIGVVCAFALLLGGGWGLIRFLQGPDQIERQQMFYVNYNPYNTTLYLTSSKGNITTISLEGSLSLPDQGYIINFDGTCLVFPLENYEYDETTKSYSSTQILYLFNNDGLNTLSSNVESYAVAANAEAVAYVEGGYAYLYKDGQRQRIASNVYSIDCISPDGTAVGYSVQQNDMSMHGYYWNGSTFELGKNKQMFAISNGGKYLYYLRTAGNESSYFAQRGTDEDNRIRLGDLEYAYMNVDGKELMYSDGESVYILSGAKEKECIFSNSERVTPCFSELIQHRINGSDSLPPQHVCITCAKSFAGQYFSVYSEVNNRSIVYLNNQFEVQLIASNVSSYQLTNNRKILFVIRHDGSITKTDRKGNTSTLLDEDAATFCITSDGNKVFYLSSEGEVFCLNGAKKAALITDEFDCSLLYRRILYRGEKFFYAIDGNLYMSTGGKGKKIATIDEDIVDIICDNFTIQIFTGEGSNQHYYISTDGKEFQKVY